MVVVVGWAWQSSVKKEGGGGCGHLGARGARMSEVGGAKSAGKLAGGQRVPLWQQTKERRGGGELKEMRRKELLVGSGLVWAAGSTEPSSRLWLLSAAAAALHWVGPLLLLLRHALRPADMAWHGVAWHVVPSWPGRAGPAGRAAGRRGGR